MSSIISHKNLFHIIAPIYRLFFKNEVKGYDRLLDLHWEELKIPSGAMVLDAGCGTGALTKSLSKRDVKVTGMDFAPGMIRQARKAGVDCFQGDLLNIDESFHKKWDVVFLAFVAHGWKTEKRRELYQNLARMTKSKVVFHDYGQKRNFWVSLIECLEGGTYFSFIQDPASEMKEVFRKVQVIETDSFVNWYICEV